MQRKIIHLDCDCFFAAIEVRDNPRLTGKPVAVGGAPEKRGVIATCNYEARQYGVRSAIASAYAKKLCPELIIIKPRMSYYREISGSIQAIFHEYTDLVEPLSLDEAFLDVSNSTYCKGSATLIAEEIRQRVYDTQHITISAGVAPNKFLAKIASDWRKPNGLFVIAPNQVAEFVLKLPVNKIYGVGKVTATKLSTMGIATCGDLQQFSLDTLINKFGVFGERLYELAQGIDHRQVQSVRRRKSLSIEHTYPDDLVDWSAIQTQIPALLADLEVRLVPKLEEGYAIGKRLVKVKFHDFTQTTLAEACQPQSIQEVLTVGDYQRLFSSAFQRGKKPVRLLGIGVGLIDLYERNPVEQLELFPLKGFSEKQ
ncbi:DNA polymerase IV [Spartinivicinus poritis]|uniref:DNA polymerase IV n=1 Tax=Spartinivicinus poritis TaxID=2994640 RepID=A0ABT5U8T9_9GAMM|nr:DNA polymerase IV [Spartinivicinus sp. A2-2]MDE1461967.1 DNA polymerase IV [Spartinivicinus sp. A2-2]